MDGGSAVLEFLRRVDQLAGRDPHHDAGTADQVPREAPIWSTGSRPSHLLADREQLEELRFLEKFAMAAYHCLAISRSLVSGEPRCVKRPAGKNESAPNDPEGHRRKEREVSSTLAPSPWCTSYASLSIPLAFERQPHLLPLLRMVTVARSVPPLPSLAS